MKPHSVSRCGATLIELLVVLVLIGITGALVAVGSQDVQTAAPSDVQAEMRREAIHGGSIISGHYRLDRTTTVTATAYPSGLLIADTTAAPDIRSSAR